MKDATRRRGSYVSPNERLSKADLRRQRRQERRLYRLTRIESPVAQRIKQVALALFFVAAAGLLGYAIFVY